jgi:hypothetical protein
MQLVILVKTKMSHATYHFCVYSVTTKAWIWSLILALIQSQNHKLKNVRFGKVVICICMTQNRPVVKTFKI